MAAFTVPERVYRTAAGDLCSETDPSAAFLAFPAGTEISDDEAKRSGVKAFFAAPAPAAPEPTSAAEPEAKMAEPPQNKMGSAPANKAPKPGDDRAEPDKPVVGKPPPPAKGGPTGR